jgi:hypothetical protein
MLPTDTPGGAADARPAGPLPVEPPDAAARVTPGGAWMSYRRRWPATGWARRVRWRRRSPQRFASGRVQLGTVSRTRRPDVYRRIGPGAKATTMMSVYR